MSPLNPTLSAGAGQQFTATGTFSDNSTQTLVSVTWASLNNAAATISNDSGNRGYAWGVGEGSATLTACAGAICGSSVLTISTVAPSISGLSPTSGAAGTTVSISGSNFGTTQDDTSTVTFNGVSATVVSWSANAIVVQVPQGATTGNVVVTVYAAPSNGVPFTVIPTPNITGLSPTASPVGTQVTITGTNFGADPASGTVTFNGVASTPTLWSDQSITAPVPLNATSGNVVVTVLGLTSNAVPFTVLGGPVTNSPMGASRWGATATLLNTGMVLMVGGYDAGYNILPSAELFDPTTGAFGVTGDLNTARVWHTASLLDNGQVLIAGGGGKGQGYGTTIPLASAELYDPTTGGFTLHQQHDHAALLPYRYGAE